MGNRVPAYFDAMIDGFYRGPTNRFVHLGYWESAPIWPEDRDAKAAEFAAAQGRLNQVILRMASLGEGQSVLDIGCGFGGSLKSIDLAHADMQMVGLNIDPRQIEICRGIIARSENQLHWLVADAVALPFAPSRFDCVLCLEAMFHFSSRLEFFQQAARVLRPGGKLVLSDMFLNTAGKKFWNMKPSIEQDIVSVYGPWPDFGGNEGDHVELAATAGLQCIDYKDISTNTAPSFQFTAPTNTNPEAHVGNTLALAALALQRLHRDKNLTYACMVFCKNGPDK